MTASICGCCGAPHGKLLTRLIVKSGPRRRRFIPPRTWQSQQQLAHDTTRWRAQCLGAALVWSVHSHQSHDTAAAPGSPSSPPQSAQQLNWKYRNGNQSMYELHCDAGPPHATIAATGKPTGCLPARSATRTQRPCLILGRGPPHALRRFSYERSARRRRRLNAWCDSVGVPENWMDEHDGLAAGTRRKERQGARGLACRTGGAAEPRDPLTRHAPTTKYV